MAFTTTIHRGRDLIARNDTTGDEVTIRFRDVPDDPAGSVEVDVAGAVVRFGPLRSDGLAYSPAGQKRRIWVEAPENVRLICRPVETPPTATIGEYRMRRSAKSGTTA